MISELRPGETRAVLSLGGNLDDPLQVFRRAIAALQPSFTAPLLAAPLYRSAPRDVEAQPDFVNTVVAGTTELTAEALLAVTMSVEHRAGRRRGARGTPRRLDVDLLLFGSRVSSAPELHLPHQQLHQRRFVLQPLADIAPDLRVPGCGLTVGELLAAAPADPSLRRIAQDWL